MKISCAIGKTGRMGAIMEYFTVDELAELAELFGVSDADVYSAYAQKGDN